MSGATSESNAKLLSLIAEMGAPAGLVSALIEMGGQKMDLDDARFLRGPIIFHKGSSNWGETIPKWMFDQVRAERTEIATGQLKMPVGPTEIAVVMYPATLEAPLEYRASELYIWATTRAVARHQNKPLEKLCKELGFKVIPDEEVFDPRGLLHETYRNLVREIRSKVIRAQEARERGEKSEARQEALRVKPTVSAKAPPGAEPPRAPPPRPAPQPPPRQQPKRPKQPPRQGVFSWLWKGVTVK